jgi:hypothetical protein
MTTAIVALPRFGARRSAQVPTEWLGDDVHIEFDFREQFTAARALVDVSSVTAQVCAPSGALVDPAITPERIAAGTWRVTVPTNEAGTWIAEITCTSPGTAIGSAIFVVQSAEP